MASDESNKWFANRGQLIQIVLAAGALILAGKKTWPDRRKIDFLSGRSIFFYFLAAGVLVLAGRNAWPDMQKNEFLSVASVLFYLALGVVVWIGRALRQAGAGSSSPPPASGPDARKAEEAYQRFLRVGVTNFYANRKQVPNDHWVNWLKSAKRRCILLKQAHGEWCYDPGFRPALVDRLTNRVQIEMFFLNPEGLALRLRQTEDSIGERNTKERIQRSLREVWRIRSSLEPSVRGYLKLYVYDATPSLGVTWIDDVMLVTHYLASRTNRTSPALEVELRPGSDNLYAVYAQNVDGIRAHFSKEITNDNIESFAPEERDGLTA